LVRLVHVLCITFAIILSLSAALEPVYSQEQEIAYDDGSAESWTQRGIGGTLAMDFDAPYVPLFLVRARIYFVAAGPFELNVWECPGDNLLGCRRVVAREFTAERDGEWFTADLSDSPVRLNGCFLVGVKWTTGGRPKIGLDTNNRGLSRVWDPVSSKWYRYSDWAYRGSTPDGNFMIRAIVQPAETTVTQSYTGTILTSSAKTLAANWRIDYIHLFTVVAIVATVGAALATKLRRTRPQTMRHPSHSQ
jgi:hypothetical protein